MDTLGTELLLQCNQLHTVPGHAVTVPHLPEAPLESYINDCLSGADYLAHVAGWHSKEHRNLVGLIKRHEKDLRKLRRLSSSPCSNRQACNRERNRLFKSFAGRACGELRHLQQSRRKGAKASINSKVSPISWKQFEKQVRASPVRSGKADRAIIFPK